MEVGISVLGSTAMQGKPLEKLTYHSVQTISAFSSVEGETSVQSIRGVTNSELINEIKLALNIPTVSKVDKSVSSSYFNDLDCLIINFEYDFLSLPIIS